MNTQQLGGWQGRPSVGHVARLKLFFLDDVRELATPDEFPEPGRPHTVLSQGLFLAEGAVATELVFPPHTCVFSESSSFQAGGLQYALSINTAFVGPDAALLAWLDQNRERRFLAVWLGYNGKVYQAGEPDNGLRLATTRGLTERDALNLTLQGGATHPVWFRDSYAETRPTSPEFDAAFDFSFS